MPRQHNISDFNVSLPSDKKKFYANNLCSTEKKVAEKIAWNEALLYATALSSWHVNSSYQEAMDLYMGNDTRGPLGDIVEANILGAAKVHTTFTWPEKQKLFILCQEPKEVEDLVEHFGCNRNGVIAYEFDDIGSYFENHFFVFCPEFYKRPTLFKALSRIRKGVADKTNIWNYIFNRGEIYFHESLHLADLTTPLDHPIIDSATDSTTDPSIYGPEQVLKEASEKNTAGCVHTADAYTCAAAAILAQQMFDLAEPPTIPPNGDKGANIVRLSRRKLSFNGTDIPTSVHLHFPDPNTPDNHIAVDRWGFGPRLTSRQNANVSEP